MMNAGIYKITLTRGDGSRRFYIGQSVNLKGRFAKHVLDMRANRHHNAPMQRAFAKYGEMAFSFDPVIICAAEKETLRMYEQIVLDFHMVEHGPDGMLNIMRECVASPIGVKRRLETRERISAAHKGRKKTPEQVAKMSERQKGFRHSEETKRRMSDQFKATPRHANSLAALDLARNSDARLEGLRAVLVGKPKIHSDETKAKIAASLSGKKQSADLIERRISALRGRKQSPEQIAKRVASRLANAAKRKGCDNA